MAALRRAAAKEKKESADRTRHLNPESIVDRLLHHLDPDLGLLHLDCWVDAGGEEEQCRSWFRTGVCLHKKCRLPHLDSLPPANNIHYSPEDSPVEAVARRVDLFELSRQQYSLIRFLFLDNLCIFDSSFPDVWAQYYVSPTSIFKRKSVHRLHPIQESDDPCTSESPYDHDPSTLNSTFYIQNGVFSGSYCFLNIKELLSLMSCSKQLKHDIQRHEQSRRRLKEANDLIAGELKKKKAEEKKKRTKSAFKKVLYVFFSLRLDLIQSFRRMTRKMSSRGAADPNALHPSHEGYTFSVCYRIW